MNGHELFSYSTFEEQTHLAECELTAFINAVTELLGPERAEFATQDWLQEADLIDSPPFSMNRNWRSVTIAASARLLTEIEVPQDRKSQLTASTDTNVSFIPSFNCFTSTLLV
jgi:hypothetical protein